jgi:hypothetical protein
MHVHVFILIIYVYGVGVQGGMQIKAGYAYIYI